MFGVGFLPALHGLADAADTQTPCRVTYETADGIFVDAGAEAGIRQGEVGWLEKDGNQLARVEVVKVSTSSTFLRVLSERLPGAVRAGDEVTLVLRAALPEAPATDADPSETLKDQEAPEEPFVPLLAAPAMEGAAASEGTNIFHGRISLRQLYQIGSESDDDYAISRLRTTGSLQRIDGTPWTLEWSGELSYRAGDELRDIRNFEEIRLEAYRLALFRRFDDRSIIRLGRFIPDELPSVGFLDGIQGEKVIDENLRLGGMLGLKPNRLTTSPSFDEPTLVGYLSWQRRNPPHVDYSSTAGVLFSLFEEDVDRLAFLWDQRARFGPVSIFSSSIVDFDVGAADFRSGTRLTRWDLYLSYAVSPALELRGGVDKYELPDNEAERDLVSAGAVPLGEFFADDTWRYWAGALHRLPLQLRLSERVSFMDSESLDRLHWSVSLTRTGLPSLPAGSVTLSAYGISAIETDGFGVTLSAYLPCLEGRLFLLPGVAVRYAAFETSGANFFDAVDDDLWVTEVSLRAQWMLSKSWLFSGGVTYTRSEDVDRFLLDLGLTFKW